MNTENECVEDVVRACIHTRAKEKLKAKKVAGFSLKVGLLIITDSCVKS